jgi:hypothetical protein
LTRRRHQIALFLACLLATSLAVSQETETTREKVSSLQGRAYLGRNAPVIGATALVQSQERSADLYLTSSDDKGRFRVDGLPEGLYRVRVERQGLVPRSMEDIAVRYPFRAVVELAMARASDSTAGGSEATPATAGSRALVNVSGKVVEQNGGPAGDIRMRFVKRGGGDDPRILRSAADGSFALPAMTAGEWQVEINGVGLLPQRISLDLIEDANLTVIMARQPPGYEQTPLDLMPPEQPIPPSH